MEELDQEGKRAIREGLDEEHLALFDLLAKPQLSPANREKLKRVSQQLLDALKAERLRIDSWREKEVTRADVRAFIFDFLYDEQNGLPADDYTDEDVAVRTLLVFEHIYQQYPDIEHSVYQFQ